MDYFQKDRFCGFEPPLLRCKLNFITPNDFDGFEESINFYLYFKRSYVFIYSIRTSTLDSI